MFYMPSIILATTPIAHTHDARCSTQKCRKLDTMTWRFVLLMALYRGLYILNWVYRCYTEVGYRHHYEVYAAGVVQTALYSRFFWYYYCSSSSYCGSSSSSNSSSSSEQHTDAGAIQLPILLCGASSEDVDAAEAVTAAAVTAQRMHDPAVLLSDDAVRAKELLEPLQPGLNHVV
jgi:hypothetical protein